MSMTDFEFEFHSEVDTLPDDLPAQIETRLRELGDGHKDVIGAAVSVTKMEGKQDVDHQCRARVVVYMKPENRVAVEKNESPEQALRKAVDAVIRQVRDHWDKLRTQQRRKERERRS